MQLLPGAPPYWLNTQTPVHKCPQQHKDTISKAVTLTKISLLAQQMGYGCTDICPDAAPGLWDRAQCGT